MENPYSPPLDTNIAAPQEDSAESIRNAHIKTEASVKSVGTLMLLSSILIMVSSTPVIMALIDGNLDLSMSIVWLQIFVLIPIAIFQIFLGMGVRKLQKWSRVPTLCLAGLSLINLPIGTLFGAYILYLLFSQKGKMVFSDEYQAIIQETPHIKYKTSIILKIALVVVIVLVLLGLGAAFFSPPR